MQLVLYVVYSNFTYLTYFDKIDNNQNSKLKIQTTGNPVQKFASTENEANTEFHLICPVGGHGWNRPFVGLIRH